jgi:hypothetical protein
VCISLFRHTKSISLDIQQNPSDNIRLPVTKSFKT